MSAYAVALLCLCIIVLTVLCAWLNLKCEDNALAISSARAQLVAQQRHADARDASLRQENARVLAMAEESLRSSRECLRRSQDFIDACTKPRPRG